MQYIAVRVRESDGRDYPGTLGMITGEYISLGNFLRYQKRNFQDDTLYAVYYNTNMGEKDRFIGFHSDLSFSEYARRSTIALAAENR